MIQDELKKWVGELIEEVFETKVDFVVESPDDRKHGDYATNVAMVLSKQLKKNPIEIAGEIARKLNENKLESVEKVEVVRPGFINFFLKSDVFSDVVKSVIDHPDSVGKNKKLAGQKILVEYTDPNPFKEFHIGHLMSNSIGEALSRIISNEGAEVKRLSYGGDVGLHVAKSIWAVLQKKDQISDIKNMDKKEQLKFWATAYVAGSTAYEENVDAKNEIDELNKKIFQKSDVEINSLYDWGREVSIEHFQEMFLRLGSHFDKNFWESEVVDSAMNAVEDGLAKNIFQKSDGAVIFKGEDYSLHTRVFVNSKGIPTYEAKELGLGVKKMELYSFDKSIVITGNEQNDYFKVLLKAMDLLRPEIKDKTIHIGHGMLRFAEGKMSSRKGNVITAVTLIDDIKDLVMEKMKDREMTNEKKLEVAETVAIGALKYSILRQTAGKDIIFDMEKSVSFEGDSGPYLQYSVVRANSILKKADGLVKVSTKMPNGWQTTDLEKMFENFEGVVSRAGDEYAPHYIVTYLTELASEFNAFYAQNKIIDENDLSSPYKLSMTQAFVNIMTKGLDLLGIKVPDQM